jgi:transcriptional regulator with XRE-family HTH domain
MTSEVIVERRSGGYGRGMSGRASPVGGLLRQWRHTRRMSQLALASHAAVSARHLSFVESGRSAPSRDMIITLASALDVPLRDRNQLLLAGGYAPAYRESALTDPAMASVRQALDRVLAHHEPYPAVVMDRHWTVLAMNEPATTMFDFLLQGAPATTEPPNVVRLMFGPLRPYVDNWDEVGPGLVQRVHREAVGGTLDATAEALLAEVLSGSDIPPAWRIPDRTATIVPVIPVRFSRDGVTVNYFSMVSTVGTPQDITAQEIRLECFFPVDDATSAYRWV